MNLFPFVIVVLASYRITRLLQDDVLLDPVRSRLKARWSERGGRFWIEGFFCAWCLGFWVSAALVAGLAQVVSVPLPGLVALAVSSGVGIISEVVERLGRG